MPGVARYEVCKWITDSNECNDGEMLGEDIKELKRLGDEALERYQDMEPYMMVNEANAVRVVGLRPPADIDTYPRALDGWAEELELAGRRSAELRDAHLRITEAKYSGRTLRSISKKINANWETRDTAMSEVSKRIQTLRSLRPQT